MLKHRGEERVHAVPEGLNEFFEVETMAVLSSTISEQNLVCAHIFKSNRAHSQLLSPYPSYINSNPNKNFTADMRKGKASV